MLVNCVAPAVCVFVASALSAFAAEPEVDLAGQLQALDAGVIAVGTSTRPPLASMLSRDAAARLREACRADSAAWAKVADLDDWNRQRDRRVAALRASMGTFPEVPKDLKVKVVGSLEGDGYRIDKITYVSRPGLTVTANLYRPAKPTAKMPAIILSLLHQYPKFNIYCQSMGATWARAGCLVLVPDHIGHGERRQHPFGSEADYEQPFPKTRHDYQHRYDNGIKLHLVGDSLMGWFVWDLMRGVDVLLAQSGADPTRVIIVSEPAGGGDIAAVTAALDPRITGAVINNFGGPQPETAFPLPRDVEDSFDYAGSGGWESTRNLRLSARDGFLPWAILASIAPRKLLYHQEFVWDDRDPVFKRLQQVYARFESPDALAVTHGWGFVVGAAPKNTHWLSSNRESFYPHLQRWFAIPDPGKEFVTGRRGAKDLLCLSGELVPGSLNELAGRLADERAATARAARAGLTQAQLRQRMRVEWSRLLGDDGSGATARLIAARPADELPGVRVERLALTTEPGIVVPALLLVPTKAAKPGVVIALAQEGKQAILRARAQEIAALLQSGSAVCIPDLRGFGETDPGGRGRTSAATSAASSEQMLGRTMLGARLRDLRGLIAHLRTRTDVNAARPALWGMSFAEANAADVELNVPHDAAKRPAHSEPAGGLLALLGALYEDDVGAVLVTRGLTDFRSALDGAYCHLPYDAVVPGVLATGDLVDLLAALAPCSVRLADMVDARNCAVDAKALASMYAPAKEAWRSAGSASALNLEGADAAGAVRWLMQVMTRN